MKLEEQVCSLELAKRLKELGVKQESVFVWRRLKNQGSSQKLWEVTYCDYCGCGDEYNCTHAAEEYAAFTVAELGEMLPFAVETSKRTREGHTHFYCIHPHGVMEIADTEADARAKMLIYLLENKLITV